MKHIHLQDIVLFEDENICILNKPANITSEQENASGAFSLAEMARRYDPKIMLCHRLDKETSGVIVAAKNEEWYRYMSILFQKRKVVKEYHALTEGVHKFDEQEINAPLSKKGSHRAVIDRKEGKPATTIINTLENFRHYTLLKANPLTGRFHQIRIHMAYIKKPLVGDELYGGKPFFLSNVKRRYKTGLDEDEQPVLGRTALHAAALYFEYPEGKPFTVTAPYPKDLDTTIKLLRKHDSFDVK